MRKHQIFGFALATAFSALFIFACSKGDTISEPAPIDKDAPRIPDGDRIIIHFGTSTYKGCLYSFSNCIWIGWGSKERNYMDNFGLQFGNGAAAEQYFGQYFPLTADYVVTKSEAAELGLKEQVIRAGFYPIRKHATGMETNMRMVDFSPESVQPVASVVNPNNPQDNIGQLHNLAVQVVLNENMSALRTLGQDKSAVQALLTEKTAQFLAEAQLPASATEQQRAQTTNVHRDYSDYIARLEETRLSDNDKNVLRAVFNEAASMPVRTPQELSNFVSRMTAFENELSGTTNLNNRKMVLSMISVLKYSRYYWFWKSISSREFGTGTDQPASIPDWVWADVIGLELGGPLVSAIASAAVYLDQR
ncbi:MAG: hypothetical protein ABMA02_14560 [Saprospiraceae bacterium]